MTKIIASAFSLSLALVSSTLSAATFVVPDDRILVKRADAIVYGNVVTQSYSIAPDGGPETVTTISVGEVLKGQTLGATINVHEMGGPKGNRFLVIPGAAQFQPGERVLVFLNRDKHGHWRTEDLVLGKFTRVAARGHESLLLRDKDEVFGWDAQNNRHIERSRSEARFLAFVRNEARGFRGNDDYIVDETSAAATTAAATTETITASAAGPITAMASPAPNYVDRIAFDPDGGGPLPVTDRPVRWQSFGSGAFFRNSNTQPNASNGGVDAIIAGTAMWTNDCASLALYSYGGTTPNAQRINVSDDVNGVAWEDAFQEVPGSATFSGGTLALGGYWVGYSETNIVEGVKFHPIEEGNVVGNNGLSTWSGVSNPSMMGALLAHELGHTLGFRHSNTTGNGGTACNPCTSDAIMNASLQPSIISLRQYDIDAVGAVYPGGSCAVNNVRGDFNGDGRADLLWRNYSTGAVNVWFMNGSQYISGTSLFNVNDPNWRLETTGDFNQDGDTDLVWRNYSNGDVNVWYMNGSSYVSGATMLSVTDLNWEIESANDFNADGRTDLLWRNYSTGAVNVWFMNGATYTGGSTLFSVADANWKLAGSADFNADGRPDLLWRNQSTGAVNVWYLNGTTYVSGASLFSVNDSNWRIEAIGDYSNDGKTDIIWRNYSTGAVNVWYLNDSTYTGGVSLFTVTDMNWQISGPR